MNGNFRSEQKRTSQAHQPLNSDEVSSAHTICLGLVIKQASTTHRKRAPKTKKIQAKIIQRNLSDNSDGTIVVHHIKIDVSIGTKRQMTNRISGDIQSEITVIEVNRTIFDSCFALVEIKIQTQPNAKKSRPFACKSNNFSN